MPRRAGIYGVKARLRRVCRNYDGAWFRVYRDGSIWAGRHGIATRWSVGGNRLAELKQALEHNGFRCELNGKPGTSGEFIIDVYNLRLKSPL
ncbi:MAG TPA: hypothetical protein PK205_07095 [Promineifilum sp.]|nr:hypothetical protein [Promineifilum sp.]